jgi:hypothetical protein
MDKTEHLTICHRFWVTTLTYWQSINSGGQVIPAKTGHKGRFFQQFIFLKIGNFRYMLRRESDREKVRRMMVLKSET